MDKTRSIANRNLLGGFLGGFGGIMVSGYLHPAVLPLGVIAGVLIGWWHEDILKVFIDSFQKGVQFGKNSYNFLAESAIRPWISLSKVYSRIHLDAPIRICLIILSAILVAFMWVIYRPIAFIRWPYVHPMNRAYLARTAAGVTFAVVTTLWVSLIVIQLMPDTLGGGMDYTGKTILFTATGFSDLFLFTFLGSLFPIMFGVAWLDGKTEMKGFYHSYERYSSQGFLGFYLKELLSLLWVQIKMFSYLIATVLYFTGTGSLFIVAIVIPFSTFIYGVKGIQRIVMRGAHWLCLSVTMAITIYSAIKFSPYFDSEQVLWTVAFVTGALSGATTELIRSILDQVFHKTTWGRRYLVAEPKAYLKDHLSHKGRIVLQGWARIGIKSPLP